MAIGRQGSDKQTVGFLRRTVNYNDTGISSGVLMGTLPKGAHIIQTSVHIRTAFNAGTTNVLTVGTNSSSYNDLIGTATVDETSLGYTVSAPVVDVVYPTGDLGVYAKYAQTGTAATAGVADVVVTYVWDDNLYV